MAESGTAYKHATEPWALTRLEPGSIDEAIALAKKHGVAVPDFIRFDVHEDLVPSDAHASYLMIGIQTGLDAVRWDDCLNRFGQVPVHLRRDVLRSDEAVVAVFAHEIHEITGLRELFEASGGVLHAGRIHQLISPT